MAGRPAAQRGDQRLACVAGYRAELGQQRHQPGKRHSGFGAVIPVGRVQRLPGRLVISVAQVMQRRLHRPPQAAGALLAVLAKDREQRHRQQAHAVFVLRVRLRRAHRAQGRQPCGKQVCVARRPALERGTAAHPPAADLQQARRDRDAPGTVQRPDVGHRAQPRRHVHADSRARRRHVGPAQHLPGRYRTAARPDPASQRDGPAHDNAFTCKPRRVAKLNPGNRHVHIGTLLPPGGPGRQRTAASPTELRSVRCRRPVAPARCHGCTRPASVPTATGGRAPPPELCLDEIEPGGGVRMSEALAARVEPA